MSTVQERIVIKPLRSINISSNYKSNDIPIMDNIEKRKEILKRALINAQKIKVR